jgi:hypothetical protein
MNEIKKFISPTTLFVLDIDETLMNDIDHPDEALLEPTLLPAIFHTIKQKAWGVISITARGTSTWYQSFTLNQMKRFKLDFSPFFSKNSAISCILGNDTNKAFYNNGIIFVEGSHKGEALNDFLIHLSSLPETIVFVDDRAYNLEHVEESFKNNSSFTSLQKIILCKYR